MHYIRDRSESQFLESIDQAKRSNKQHKLLFCRDIYLQEDTNIAQLFLHLEKAFKCSSASLFHFKNGDIWIIWSDTNINITPIVNLLKGEFVSTSEENAVHMYDLRIHYEIIAEYAKSCINSIGQRVFISSPQEVKFRIDNLQMEIFLNAAQKRAARNGSSLVVLVVDDHCFINKIITDILSDHAHCIVASNAADGLNKYILNAPDLSFIDINLPDQDGHQLTETIVSFDSEAKVVMLTGSGDLEDVAAAKNNSVYSYIKKPFPPKKIIDIVTQIKDLAAKRA